MSERRPLGVALVGAAFMGRAHSRGWRDVGTVFEVPAFERRVLVGRDAARASETAARLGWAEASDDWRAVLARPDIDVVDICTPGGLHAEMAIAALEAGKHVLVEKPLANSLAEAERMVEAACAAESRGQRAMIGFNYRTVPALELARRLVADGRIGALREIRLSYLQDWLCDPTTPMTWRLRRESAGSGALGDLGAHLIDQLRFLSGQEVVGATGRLATFIRERPGRHGLEPVTVDDAAWATLELSCGAIASFEVSRVATGKKNALSIELFGEEGAIGFDLERLNELRVLDARDPVDTRGPRKVLVTEPEHPFIGAWWPQGHVLGWENTFVHEVRELLLAIDEQRRPSPDFSDGLAVQRVLEAIERSAVAAPVSAVASELA